MFSTQFSESNPTMLSQISCNFPVHTLRTKMNSHSLDKSLGLPRAEPETASELCSLQWERCVSVFEKKLGVYKERGKGVRGGSKARKDRITSCPLSLIHQESGINSTLRGSSFYNGSLVHYRKKILRKSPKEGRFPQARPKVPSF